MSSCYVAIVCSLGDNDVIALVCHGATAPAYSVSDNDVTASVCHGATAPAYSLNRRE